VDGLSRRGFLGSIIAACAAPVIVRSGLLMPVKPALVVPSVPLLTPEMITREALNILHQKLEYLSLGNPFNQVSVSLLFKDA